MRIQRSEIYCDACGKEIQNPHASFMRVVTYKYADEWFSVSKRTTEEESMDLCNKCFHNFKDLIKEGKEKLLEMVKLKEEVKDVMLKATT